MTARQTAVPADTRGDRILFLGKRFYTNKDALVEHFGRIYQLPANWAEKGSRVLLWLVDYHSRQPAKQISRGLDVISTPVLSFSMARGFAALLRLRPNIVVASGDSYIGLVGWMISRMLGAVFVFDVYDKYDEFAGYRKFLGFDLFAFLRRRADIKFFCSRALLDYYDKHEGRSPSAIVLNGVDGVKFAPMEIGECRARLGLPAGDVLVGYFGSMEPDRGVEDLLLAIESLRNEGEDIRLLLCGKSNSALTLDRDWITYRGIVAHDLMPFYLNASDLLVIHYRESPIMDMGASCKIAEYLMCKRPVVSTRTANFLGNFPTQAAELGNAMCTPGDVAALAIAIRRQLAERKILTAPVGMSWQDVSAGALTAIHRRREVQP